MAARSFQILCTGDVHLGRRPSRVPVEDEELSVRRIWERFVETALNREVEAVVLTGDVVDSENQMYEAYGALERGIQDLLRGGIEVVAVAGNHDHDAFPRLVRSIDADGFHLLGRGGTWEDVRVPREGEHAVRFMGWSFPQATELSSPVEDLHVSEGDNPIVGILHCEAGSTEGRYAPVPRGALARTPVDGWLLGHIHASNEHWEAEQLQLYPGSLQPLDPGEPGTHGPWLIEVSSGEIDAEQLPLASLRYETASVDVTELETAEDVEDAILRTVREGLSDRGERWPELRHVAYRLVLEGRTNLTRRVEETGREIVGSLRPEVDQVSATIEDVDFRTRPDHDLSELAESNDPPGVLAELLLKLEEGEVEHRRIRSVLRRASKATGEVYESSRYEPLRRDSATQDPPSREELREMFYQQGLLLLDELYASRS